MDIKMTKNAIQICLRLAMSPHSILQMDQGSAQNTSPLYFALY